MIRAAARKRADRLLALTGLDAFADRRPATLSGGVSRVPTPLIRLAILLAWEGCGELATNT